MGGAFGDDGNMVLPQPMAHVKAIGLRRCSRSGRQLGMAADCFLRLFPSPSLRYPSAPKDYPCKSAS